MAAEACTAADPIRPTAGGRRASSTLRFSRFGVPRQYSAKAKDSWLASKRRIELLRAKKIRFRPFLVGHFPKILPAIVVFRVGP